MKSGKGSPPRLEAVSDPGVGRGSPGRVGIGSIKGADRQVDYRLARRALISEFKKGRIPRHEVCDAHPELLRAARGVGEPTSVECPICEESRVALVSYAFGPRLGPSGRCVTSREELTRYTRAAGGPVKTYVVEVCPACSWNHLTRMFEVEPTRRRTRSASGGT